jgi:Flp pilus assembly CpaE family ATPase
LRPLLQRAARLKAEATARVHAATIGFLGVKGGVGTSTVALNTAVTLALGGGHLPPTVRTPPPDFRSPQVLLADLAPHGGLAHLLRLSQALGLPSVLAYPPQELDPPTIGKHLTPHVSGLRMLLTPYTPRPVMLSAAHIRVIARHLAALGDYVIFEMGHTLDDGARALLGELRYLVLVMEPTSLCLLHARELIQVLLQVGWVLQQLGLVVVNRARLGDRPDPAPDRGGPLPGAHRLHLPGSRAGPSGGRSRGADGDDAAGGSGGGAVPGARPTSGRADEVSDAPAGSSSPSMERLP